ncbi:hypothetical protein NCC78_14025 [Micromonospora phytophila]|uniref:hypothetical protein n=1 Tax=Micromonospora phytophila TaxID=709888 RepID=UPI00203032FA|nr:hypothetical protein [Micromonospora phytophila]MCM0675798.1 hypothetical protein [Micromonospora phytophila]
MPAIRNLSNRLYVAAVLASVVAVALTQVAGGDTGTAVLAEGFGWTDPGLSDRGQS